MWSHDQTACAKNPLNWSRRSENAQDVVCDFEKSRIFFRFFQKLKIFEGNTVIVKTFSKYFLSCTFGVGFVLLVVSRLFIFFVKMIGTFDGQESPNVSAENELNHLLTMFTQKFYEAIKGFQFDFARGIVYDEESSKSS